MKYFALYMAEGKSNEIAIPNTFKTQDFHLNAYINFWLFISIERTYRLHSPCTRPVLTACLILNLSFCNFVFDLHGSDSGDSVISCARNKYCITDVFVTRGLFSPASVTYENIMPSYIYVCMYVTYVQRDVIGDFDRKRFSASK